jgi:hypothetical protein
VVVGFRQQAASGRPTSCWACAGAAGALACGWAMAWSSPSLSRRLGSHHGTRRDPTHKGLAGYPVRYRPIYMRYKYRAQSPALQVPSESPLFGETQQADSEDYHTVWQKCQEQIANEMGGVAYLANTLILLFIKISHGSYEPDFVLGWGHCAATIAHPPPVSRQVIRSADRSPALPGLLPPALP